MSERLSGHAAVERALAAARRAGADQADAILVEGRSFEARVRGDDIEHVKQADEHALGIRALVRGGDGFRSALTSTSDLSAQAVDRMAEETVALARATAPDPAAGLPEGGFAEDLPDLGLADPDDAHLDLEARIDSARRAERAARAADPRITNSEGSEASSGTSHIIYANSAGFRGDYVSGSHSLTCMPVATENGSMQTDYWFSVARTLDRLDEAEAVGRRAAERALRRLGARRVPTCEVPVIFDAPSARSLLSHLAACVNGGAVYRDASFLAGRLGKHVAGERVTVIDDGRRPGGLGSKPFDGDGRATGRTTLLHEGRLESWLLDTYTGRKLGMESTGNASRGVGSAPSPGPTNLWLEPGDATLEEIIADTERGLLVTWMFGHGFNPVTGDFSRGAGGLWIENGHVTHPVEEVTVAGNLLDMLQGIDAVGSDLTWLGAIASPSLRVAKLTVAGE